MSQRTSTKGRSMMILVDLLKNQGRTLKEITQGPKEETIKVVDIINEGVSMPYLTVFGVISS